MRNYFNIPNLFTFARLALTPVIILSIRGGRHIEALALFFLAAVTDVLDGWTARRLHVATPVGAYFDPIADKGLLSGVYFALAWAGIVPWWLVAIIFGRDIFILLGVGIVMFFTPVRRFPPSVWGKVSTFVQIDTAIAWMVRDAFPLPFFIAASSFFLWLCVGFTLWSGIDYARRGAAIARSH